MREKIIINKSKTKKIDFIILITNEIEPYNGGNLTNFPNWESLELYNQKKGENLIPPYKNQKNQKFTIMDQQITYIGQIKLTWISNYMYSNKKLHQII